MGPGVVASMSPVLVLKSFTSKHIMSQDEGTCLGPAEEGARQPLHHVSGALPPPLHSVVCVAYLSGLPQSGHSPLATAHRARRCHP